MIFKEILNIKFFLCAFLLWCSWYLINNKSAVSKKLPKSDCYEYNLTDISSTPGEHKNGPNIFGQTLDVQV